MSPAPDQAPAVVLLTHRGRDADTSHVPDEDTRPLRGTGARVVPATGRGV
ncbi:hypothetical protein [Streptomyces sp. NPDC059786]